MRNFTSSHLYTISFSGKTKNSVSDCTKMNIGNKSRSKGISCTMCPKIFPSCTELDSHILENHKIKAKFICGQCGEKFVYNDNVLRHPPAFCQQQKKTTSKNSDALKTKKVEKKYYY